MLILRRTAPTPSVTLTTNGDSVSQEGNEDFFLVLSIIGLPLPSGFFLRDRLRIIILDDSGTHNSTPLPNC